MRSQKTNNVTLQYPDRLAFAFNPFLVIAKLDAGLKSIAVTIKCGDTTASVSYDAFNGTAYADLREFLQSLFDGVQFGVDYTAESKLTDLGKAVDFTVVCTAADDDATTTTFTFTTFVIWGALQPGETYNDLRTVTYFVGFPFTFGIYTDGGGTLIYKRDGVPSAYVTLPDAQGVYNIKIPSALLPLRYFDVCTFDGQLTLATFDNTFDMTFHASGNGTSTKKLRINVVKGIDDGVYLRWVDRFGFYCYYLFKRGDQTRQTAVSDNFLRNNLLDYNQEYGYQMGAGNRHVKQRADTWALCAPNVDADQYDALQDLTTSPVVDMLRGYDDDGAPKWVAVNIEAGSFVKTNAALQDFVVNMTLQAVPIQTL